jgi:hypothetical protein
MLKESLTMNNRDIVSQNIKEFEKILINIMKNLDEENINFDKIEILIKTAIQSTLKIILNFISIIINSSKYGTDCKCPNCNRGMKVVSKNAALAIMTLFGKIAFKRDYLVCRNCGYGAGKGDKNLNINRYHKMTNGMIELITYVGQLVPFGEGKKVLEKFYGFLGVEASESTIQKVTEEVGKKVYENDLNKASYLYDNYHKLEPKECAAQKGDLYVLMDGSHINTRIEDENGSTWHELKLGEVFSSRDIIKRENEDSIITKKTYCTYLGSVNTFKKVLLKNVYDSGYLEHKNTIIIADGAKWIWNLAEEFFPESIKILDFYHLAENINRYAKVIYPENEIARKKWVNKIIKYVKNGKEDLAIQNIEKAAIPKDKLPAGVVNLPEYITNNRERIKYQEYKEKGYYIGSGPIESGNKTVIQQRMKLSGMRWSIDGAQFIAALRAKYKSNKWNEDLKVI